MTERPNPRTDLEGLDAGTHVCWLVEDDSAYVDHATAVLMESAARGLKPIAFGPDDGDPLQSLAPVVSLACDPRTAILERGHFQPEAMFEAFRARTAQARAEGYGGVCVVADMDWMAGVSPTAESVVAFELLLGAVAKDLGAIIVCAYRTSSFDDHQLDSLLAVHEVGVGASENPQFQLVAAGGEVWQLAGELDIAVASTFETAITTVVEAGDCVVDLSRVEFMDVISMGLLAAAGAGSPQPVQLLGASSGIRRTWDLGNFAQVAPMVRFQ